MKRTNILASVLALMIVLPSLTSCNSASIGDGIEDINTASESIIATMQAFGVGAEQAMQIVDKFNEVGNNYAISSKGVGDALLRSAAAMFSGRETR